MIVRNAVECDRDAIAGLIVEAFAKKFSLLDKNLALVVKAMRSSLVLEHVFVSQEEDLIGVIVVSSRASHAIQIDKRAFINVFGFIKGSIGAAVLRRELQPKVALTDSAAYIEVVAVDQQARGRGVASAMLRHLTTTSRYTEYYLEVIDTNEAAIRCYRKFGFAEVSRRKERFAGRKGFQYRLIMRLLP